MEDPKFPFRAIVIAALDAPAVKTDVSDISEFIDVSSVLDAAAVKTDVLLFSNPGHGFPPA